MYRRAGLSRIVTIVVALLCTAVPASTLVREFRSADNRNEHDPTVHQALRHMGRLVAGSRHHIQPLHSREHGEVKVTLERGWAGTIDPDSTNVGNETVAGIFAKAERDIAIAGLSERIRNVE